MKVRSILSEAGRNVASGTSRTLGLWFALTLVTLTITVLDAAAVQQLVSSSHRFQDSGAATQTISAAGAIDGTACDALAAIPGISAAGALRSDDRSLTLALLPGTPVPMYDVSVTVPDVFHSSQTGQGGVYIPGDVLQALGDAGPPTSLQTADGKTAVAGVYTYPSDGRRAGFGWAALKPVDNSQPFDECWATAWPQQPAMSQLLLNTITPDASTNLDYSSVQIAQLNGRLGYAFNGAIEYRHRPTRFAPVMAAFAGFLIAMLGIWLRRIELAAKLHDGARRGDLQWMLMAETTSWAVPAFLVATAGGVLAGVHAGFPDQGNIAMYAAVTSFTALLGSIAGTAIGMRRIRESLLFQYFKDR